MHKSKTTASGLASGERVWSHCSDTVLQHCQGFQDAKKLRPSTPPSLAIPESEKLATDLQKVEQLELKITSELSTLRERIDTMGSEIETYSDIDKLKSDGEARKIVSRAASSFWRCVLRYVRHCVLNAALDVPCVASAALCWVTNDNASPNVRGCNTSRQPAPSTESQHRSGVEARNLHPHRIMESGCGVKCCSFSHIVCCRNWARIRRVCTCARRS